MKTCTRCGEKKELALFAKDSRRPGGRGSHCCSCVAEKARKWQQNNPEKANAKMKKWRDENRDKLNQTAKSRHDKNPEKERVRSRKWKKENLAKVAAWQARRRAAQMAATPARANPFLVEEVYDLAQRRNKATGFMWHVDHIVPLRGKRVCGLHVESNLRVIPWLDNIKKSNKFAIEELRENRK